jgi:hypothetical protein
VFTDIIGHLGDAALVLVEVGLEFFHGGLVFLKRGGLVFLEGGLIFLEGGLISLEVGLVFGLDALRLLGQGRKSRHCEDVLGLVRRRIAIDLLAVFYGPWLKLVIN